MNIMEHGHMLTVTVINPAMEARGKGPYEAAAVAAVVPPPRPRRCSAQPEGPPSLQHHAQRLQHPPRQVALAAGNLSWRNNHAFRAMKF